MIDKVPVSSKEVQGSVGLNGKRDRMLSHSCRSNTPPQDQQLGVKSVESMVKHMESPRKQGRTQRPRQETKMEKRSETRHRDGGHKIQGETRREERETRLEGSQLMKPKWNHCGTINFADFLGASKIVENLVDVP
jgi:hypothetical protein